MPRGLCAYVEAQTGVRFIDNSSDRSIVPYTGLLVRKLADIWNLPVTSGSQLTTASQTPHHTFKKHRCFRWQCCCVQKLSLNSFYRSEQPRL